MEQFQRLMFWIVVGFMVAALLILFGKEVLFNLLGTEVTVNV